LKYDIAIRGGRIVDGTGGSWFIGDVAVSGERIAKIGKVDPREANSIVDASGMVVSPGWVDIHCHSDISILINPQADSLVRQGITTILNGVCGTSAAPRSREYAYLFEENKIVKPDWTNFDEYFGRIEKQGVSINVGSFVGLGNCRIAAMGEAAWDRTPTEGELDRMKMLVEEAMQQGAFGLSTGLEYQPQTIVRTEEIIELAKVAGKYGGIYATHIRSRDVKVVEAAEEAIEIGEKAGIPVEGSHFGARFPSDGKTKHLVDLCLEARRRGADIAFDQIPWTMDEDGVGWCGGDLASIITWGSKYTAKGRKVTLDMLKDPKVVEFLKRDLHNRQYGPILAGSRGLLDSWDRVRLAHCEQNPQYNGMNLREIGKMTGKDPFDALIDILVAEGEDFERIWGAVGITSQWDTDFSLLHPLSSVTIDSGIDAPYGPLAEEPVFESTTRAYGQFPYFFEKWVRKERLLTLEDAVRKCSGLPAQRVRIMDRGLLRPGMFADIVVFDHRKIGNRATLENPRQYPSGIKKVLVNGSIVVDSEEHTNRLSGKILRLNGR